MIGEFIPFSTGATPYGTDKHALKLNKWENAILPDVSICIWPSTKGDATPPLSPESCIIEVVVFYSSENNSIPLIDLMRAEFTGNHCGKDAEIIALQKLQSEIEELITTLQVEPSP